MAEYSPLPDPTPKKIEAAAPEPAVVLVKDRPEKQDTLIAQEMRKGLTKIEKKKLEAKMRKKA